MRKNYTPIIKLLKSNLKNLGLILACVASALPAGVSAQGPTYTFVTAGATGSAAPTVAQINAAYSGTNNLNGLVTSANGVQSFTVPSSGPYRITAIGAQGGYNGGRAASMTGDYTLTAGTVLKIIVGQQGSYANNNSNGSGGGGGGSYVALGTSIATSTPMVVAGGGGGNADGYNGLNVSTPCCLNGMEATITTGGNGYAPATTGGVAGPNGGTGGNGGLCNGSFCAGSGAGFYGGALSCQSGQAATSFTAGGTAGINLSAIGNPNDISGDGGFGGGGGCYNSGTGERGGGGGGYSGGGGGVANAIPGYDGAGGGGGSYNSGANQTNSITTATGNGRVLISLLCDIRITASGASSLTPAICNGQTLSLSTNAVSNYTWSTGNTTNTTIVVGPTTTTSYSVTGLSSLGCVSTGVITVTVSGGTPTLSVVSSTNSACQGSSITLTASGALTYTWTNSGVTNGVPFVPAATAIYTVTGGNGCGTTSAVTTVSISSLPVTAATNSAVICANGGATLTTTGATSYTWNPGSFNSNVYVVSPSATTIYTVTGKTGNCIGVANITVTAKPIPTLAIVANTPTTCAGGAVNLSVNGNASTYTWSTNQTGNSISANPLNTSVYSVIGTNSVNCTNSTSQVIIVYALPTVNVTSSLPEVCVGGSVTLHASGANTYAYSWSAGTGTSSTVNDNPMVTTNYNVIGTSTAGCMGTTVITVSVFMPTITVSSNTAVCLGSSAALSADGADSYIWLNNSSPTQGILVTPLVNTTYTVVGSVNNQNNLVCPATAMVDVSINPLPTITASSNFTAICIGKSATLSATGAGATGTYTWAGGIGTTPDITVSPIADQSFSVTGKDANGCKGTTVYHLVVSPCTGINTIPATTFNVFIYPNPSNGDFTISADETITLNITNELGQQVKVITLDGKTPAVKVNNLANGVYFITGKNVNGSVKQKIIVAK